MCTVTLFLMLPKCNDMTKTFHRSSVYWFISRNGPLYVCVTLRGHAYIWTHNNPYATWRRYFQLRQPLPTESTTGMSSSLHEPYVLNHLSQCLLFPFSVCFTVIRGGKNINVNTTDHCPWWNWPFTDCSRNNSVQFFVDDMRRKNEPKQVLESHYVEQYLKIYLWFHLLSCSRHWNLLLFVFFFYVFF